MSRQAAFPSSGVHVVFVQETSPGTSYPNALWLKISTKEIFYWDGTAWTLFGTIN